MLNRLLFRLLPVAPVLLMLSAAATPAEARCYHIFKSVCWVAPDGSCGCFSGYIDYCDDLPQYDLIQAKFVQPKPKKDETDKSPEKPKRPWAFKREEDVVSA